MKIRPFVPADAPLLSELYVRSVRLIGSRDYTPVQAEVWAALAPSPEAFRKMAADGRTTLVAVDEAGLVSGFIDLENDGHIDFLYCAPEAVGTGAATALYNAVEQEAHRRGIPRLYSEASEAARRFFLKKGFVELHRRNLVVAGVAIHNYAMEKHLRT